MKAPVALRQDRRILVNAYSEHARVLRDRAQQSSDPTAFGKVLVNDHVFRQPESRRHLHVADLADPTAGAADEHHFAERRGASRGAGDDPATSVYLLDAFGERRASQTS